MSTSLYTWSKAKNVVALTLSVAAALFGLFTTFAVYVLSMRDGGTSTVMIVLTGIAVNAFALGIIAYLTSIASTATREQIVFWQLGSLAGAVTWGQVQVVAPLVIAVSTRQVPA